MEGGTSRLAELKGILKASSQRTSEDFAALRKSLYAVLDGYSKVQRGAGAVCGSGAEEVEQFNDTVSKARKQLQAKCELLQVRQLVLYIIHLSCAVWVGHLISLRELHHSSFRTPLEKHS